MASAQSAAAQAGATTAAADPGISPTSAPTPDQPLASQSPAAAPSRGRVGASEVGGGAAPVIEGAGVSAARFADPAAAAPATASYSDPALAYSVASGSRETLLQTLKANPEMREQLRAKLRVAAAAADAGATSDPAQQEKLEYYRRALTEADTRAHGGSLDALTPLGAREAFSMNGEESEKEIHRLTASMSAAAEDELTATPLFPRVHQAILRQVARGSVKYAPKRTLSAGN